ncbi:hypothetical protein HK104_010585 [Borealophlyctis nickersoniae]|nr:hypothetical protein HK104_010585 [Borealophlyctis nickersoniae]
MPEDGTGTKISDLAEASRHKEKASRVPTIPLTILAPLLVIIALVGVLVPNSIILNEASVSSTGYLSDRYLALLLDDVKVKIQNTVARVYPTVEAMVDLPETISAMTTNFYSLQNESFISKLAVIKKKFGINQVVCMSGRWADGYNNTFAPSSTTINQSMVTIYIDPYGTGKDILTVMDYNGKDFPSNGEDWLYIGKYFNRLIYIARGKSRVYYLSNVTYLPENPNVPIVNSSDTDQSKSANVLMQLGVPGVEVKSRPYFLSVVLSTNARMAYVNKQKFIPADAPLPTYACLAGFRVDSAWNQVLYDARPTNTSVVSMFSRANFSIVASSKMILDETQQSGTNVGGGNVQYQQLADDNVTLALKTSVYRRFATFANVPASGVYSYEDTVVGSDPWIINLSVVNMSTYASDNLLLVAALPRSEIYGVVDAARKRSTGVAIGISVAMAVAVSCVYVAVVIPLLRLAKAMGMLTKLDFQTLENSTILDARSNIWELRKVQMTFATMVKAFAGGIKKNKDMVAKNIATASKTTSASR